MESVSVHLTKIEDLLSQMEDILEAARAVPFSNKVSIDKQAIYDIIDDLRPVIVDMQKDLPNEIIQAKRVISDGDKILNDARNKAAMVIKSAEGEVQKMTDEHEITKLATAQATQIVEEGKRNARELRLNAMEYADEILAKTEDIIREAADSFVRHSREAEAFFDKTVDKIYDNRQELRGVKQ